MVVVSIFVNPLQFGAHEDLGKYPRPLERDLKLCEAEGAQAVFVPDPAELTPEASTVFVDETGLSLALEGSSRPGHFRGVCTIVLKLFNLIQPRAAVFGKKDYQQLAVIRRMVRDLNVPVELIAGETVREADGLALSSRNIYLNEAERQEALCLREALTAARERIYCQEKSSPAQEEIQEIARTVVGRYSRPRLDYFVAADRESLEPLEKVTGPCVILGAIHLGPVRLLDNIEA